jgi:hypothetical protein
VGNSRVGAHTRPQLTGTGLRLRSCTHTTHHQHNNHAPHFPYRFTTMWDSYPVKVCVPEDATLAAMLHQPKNKMCVFKVTLGVTFTGEIVALVTLSLGINHDGRIADEEEGISFPYRLVWEWSIGDGPYEVFRRCLVPHRPQLEPGSNSRCVSAPDFLPTSLFTTPTFATPHHVAPYRVTPCHATQRNANSYCFMLCFN